VKTKIVNASQISEESTRPVFYARRLDIHEPCTCYAASTRETKSHILKRKMDGWTLDELKDNFEDALVDFEDCVTYGKPVAERNESLRLLREAVQDLRDYVVGEEEEDNKRDAVQTANLKVALALVRESHGHGQQDDFRKG